MLKGAKEACITAAANGFQVTPGIGLDGGCRQVIKKKDGYFPPEVIIDADAVQKRWADYEKMIKVGEDKYRTEANMMVLFCGQAIKGGYAVMGIDLDFEDEAKINEVDKVLKRIEKRGGTLIAKRGSKGRCYIVKIKVGKFAPFYCGGNKDEKAKYPIDWLIGKQGSGHHMNFIPPGINLKTEKSYEWLTKATIFNTTATQLATFNAADYHEIIQIVGDRAKDLASFKVKDTPLATRIARIKKYKTSTSNSSGEFEPNILEDCTFFGRLTKVKGAGLYLPTAKEFAQMYYDFWLEAYERDGKHDRPAKDVDYIAEKIEATLAGADGEVDEKRVAKDFFEAKCWLETHDVDNLAFAGGSLCKFDESRGFWKPMNETSIFNEIVNRAGCGAGVAKSAMTIINSEVKMNEHSLKIETMFRHKKRDALSKVAFLNTTVSITSQGVTCGPSKKEDYVLYGIECEYKPDAKCPKIMEQLERLFEPDAMEVNEVLETQKDINVRRDDNIRMVTQFLGYTLVPYNGFAKSLFMYGASRTGKSMIANLHRQFVEGDSGRELICSNLSINELSNPNALAMLKGKLLAICPDDDGNPQKKDINVFKRWVGGDALTVKSLYEDVFNIVPTAKYWHISNTKIEMKNTDPVASRERIIMVQTTSQTIDKSLRKVDFIDGLTTQDELEGYAILLINALCDLYKAGRFELTDWQEAEAESVTNQANLVGEYIEAMIKVGSIEIYNEGKHKASDRIITSNFKDAFLKWLDDDPTKKRDVQYWGSKQRVGDSANAWLKDNGYDKWKQTSKRDNGKVKSVYVYPMVDGKTNF